MENSIGQMERFIKDNGKMESNTDKEPLLTKMEEKRRQNGLKGRKFKFIESIYIWRLIWMAI